jgi:hypothetical protein
VFLNESVLEILESEPRVSDATPASGGVNDMMNYPEEQVIDIISRVSEFHVFVPIRTLLFSLE